MTMPLDYGYLEKSPDASAYTVRCSAVLTALVAVDSYSGMGITSVTKIAGTGLYRVTFEEAWNDLLDVTALIEKSGGAGGFSICMVAESVSTSTGGTVDFGIENFTGTLTDPASMTLHFGFVLEREALG